MTIHQSFLIQKACNFRHGLRLEISIKRTQCIIGPKKKWAIVIAVTITTRIISIRSISEIVFTMQLSAGGLFLVTIPTAQVLTPSLSLTPHSILSPPSFSTSSIFSGKIKPDETSPDWVIWVWSIKHGMLEWAAGGDGKPERMPLGGKWVQEGWWEFYLA